MKTVVQLLGEKLRDNRKLVHKLEQLLSRCPEGRIEMTTANGKPKYFLMRGGMRKYLRQEESWLIRNLLEKSYYKQLLAKAKDNQRAIEDFLKHYDPDAEARVYEKLHPHRRSLVEPLIAPDDVFVQKWLEEHRRMAAERPNPYPVTEEFVTNNGEVVRSKSEKIIADLLQHLGLYYVYECPLETPGGLTYPDFTILHPFTREDWYMEHRGLMDKEGYVDDALRKERLYASIGIFPGIGLIFSEETMNYPLRTKDVEEMIRKFFF